MILFARLSSATFLLLLSAAAAIDPNRPLAVLKKDVRIQADRLIIAINRLDAEQVRPFLYRHPAVQFGNDPRVEGTAGVLAAFREVFEDAVKFETGTDSLARDGAGNFVQRGPLKITVKAPGGTEVVTGRYKLVWKFVAGTPRLVFAQSIPPPPPSPPPRADRLLIRDVLIEADRYVIAYNRGDAAQLARFYAADAVLRMAGESPVSGKAAIVKALKEMVEGSSGLEGETKSVKKIGNGLFAQSGTYSLMERENGKDVKVTGRFRFVWRFDSARPVITVQETS